MIQFACPACQKPHKAAWVEQWKVMTRSCETAVEILSDMGEPAAPILEPFLTHDNWQARSAAEKALSAIRAKAK